MKVTLRHNHQSQRAYLHPAAYSAGSLLRDGEAWDNRAYLRYELVLCASPALAEKGEDPEEYKPEHLLTALERLEDERELHKELKRNSGGPRSSMRPAAPDFGDLIHSTSEASTALVGETHDALTSVTEKTNGHDDMADLFRVINEEPDTEDTEVGRDKKEVLDAAAPEARKFFEMFSFVLERDRTAMRAENDEKLIVTGDYPRLPTHEEGGTGSEQHVSAWKTIAKALWAEHFDIEKNTFDSIPPSSDNLPPTEREIDQVTNITQGEVDALFDSAATQTTATVSESEAVPASGKMKKKILDAFPSFIPEALKYFDSEDSRLVGEAIAALIDTKPGLLSFADVERKFLHAAVQNVQRELNGLRGRLENPVSAEDKDPGSKAALAKKIANVEAKQQRVASRLPLDVCLGLIAAGKGGEGEMLEDIITGITVLTYIEEKKEKHGFDSEKMWTDFLAHHDSAKALFTLSDREGNPDEQATTNYPELRTNWADLFKTIAPGQEDIFKGLEPDANVEALSIRASLLARRITRMLRATFTQNRISAFNDIDNAETENDVYKYMPAAAARDIGKHESVWEASIETKKRKAQAGNLSDVVTHSNFPLFYALSPHAQHLFHFVLDPSQQEAILNRNMLNPDNFPNDESLKAEIAKVSAQIFEAFKHFTKLQLLSCKGFNDLTPEQKVELGIAFCSTPQDTKEFLRLAGLVNGSATEKDFLAKLKTEARLME